MELHDMPAFAQIMIDLGELYYQSLSEVLIELYWATLKRFDIAAIRHAVDTHIHNPDVGQFMPTPADIVRCLESSATNNMLGSYKIPAIFSVNETGTPFEGASKPLRSPCEFGFCSYDEQAEYVWVHETTFHQVSEQLKPNDNRVKGINEAYEFLPNLLFSKEPLFLEKIRENTSPFEGASKALPRGFGGPSKPRAGTGARTRTGAGAGDILVAQARPCSSHSPHDVITMFEYWKTHLEHPPAKLDDKHKNLIHQAFKSGYDAGQLCEAITGCSLTLHNMGHNDSGQRYDGLHIILRDANQIDRFIYNARSPPKPFIDAKRHTQANVQTLQRWLDIKMTEEKTINGTS
jgi:hypothetical protein